jgi:hypothetical protein
MYAQAEMMGGGAFGIHLKFPSVCAAGPGIPSRGESLNTNICCGFFVLSRRVGCVCV